jgi:hypothetical protein
VGRGRAASGQVDATALLVIPEADAAKICAMLGVEADTTLDARRRDRQHHGQLTSARWPPRPA